MVLCSSYTSHELASRAVERLLAAGVPGGDVRVLMGEPERDARAAGAGTFAGSAAADAPVGDFGGAEHRQAESGGAFAGMAAGQRGGSFADADREIVTSYPESVAHMRVAGHRTVLRLLLDAGLDEPTARRDADALHHGRILVLADAGERDPAELRAVLEDQVQDSPARVSQ